MRKLTFSRSCVMPMVSPAYDIKLLVNKGTVDIVHPQWILDCVARDELVPLKKRYSIKGRPESSSEGPRVSQILLPSVGGSADFR